MAAIKGIFDGTQFHALEKVPTDKKCNVIITFIKEGTQAPGLESSADLYASLYAEGNEAQE